MYLNLMEEMFETENYRFHYNSNYTDEIIFQGKNEDGENIDWEFRIKADELMKFLYNIVKDKNKKEKK